MTTGKNIIIMAVLIAFRLTATAQSVKREYYDAWTQTRLMAEYQVNSVGEKHGWFKGYDREGVLVMENNYKNNQMHGLCKEYTTGWGKRQLSKSETYKDGELNGPAEYYNGRGVVTKKGNFVDGYKDGKWLMTSLYNNYNVDKQLKEACPLVKMDVTYERGKEVREAREGEVKEFFYPCNKLRSKLNYKNGNRVGLAIWYYPDGKIETKEEYDNQAEMIYSHSFYPDGSTKEFSGVRDGVEIFEQYDRNGNPTGNMRNWEIRREKFIQNKQLLEQARQLFAKGQVLAARDAYQQAGDVIATSRTPSPIGWPNARIIRVFLEEEEEWKQTSKFGNVLNELGYLHRDIDKAEELVLNWYDSAFSVLVDEALALDPEQVIKALDNSYHKATLRASTVKMIRDKYALQKQRNEELDALNANVSSVNVEYLNGKRSSKQRKILEVAKPIVDAANAEYQLAVSYDEKLETGNQVLQILKSLNALSDEVCKEYLKQLKGLDDESAIRTILGL